MPSQSAAARDWILGLPPGRWFTLNDIPVKPEIARPVLSRLKNDERHGIWRVAPRLYWRGFPEEHEYYKWGPNINIGALIHGGPGAGLKEWSALNALGWTLQCSPMYRVVVVGRAPSPIHRSVVYSSNSNERRANLTWAEVTVLEALDYFIYTEELWDECVERLVCGESAARLPGWGNQILVRGEALQWALETEKKQTAEKSWKVDDLAYALENSESKKVA